MPAAKYAAIPVLVDGDSFRAVQRRDKLLQSCDHIGTGAQPSGLSVEVVSDPMGSAWRGTGNETLWQVCTRGDQNVLQVDVMALCQGFDRGQRLFVESRPKVDVGRHPLKQPAKTHFHHPVPAEECLMWLQKQFVGDHNRHVVDSYYTPVDRVRVEVLFDDFRRSLLVGEEYFAHRTVMRQADHRQ